MEAGITHVMLWSQALPDHVALASLSTELGDVKMCLNAYMGNHSHYNSDDEWKR